MKPQIDSLASDSSLSIYIAKGAMGANPNTRGTSIGKYLSPPRQTKTEIDGLKKLEDKLNKQIDEQNKQLNKQKQISSTNTVFSIEGFHSLAVRIIDLENRLERLESLSMDLGSLSMERDEIGYNWIRDLKNHINNSCSCKSDLELRGFTPEKMRVLRRENDIFPKKGGGPGSR